MYENDIPQIKKLVNKSGTRTLLSLRMKNAFSLGRVSMRNVRLFETMSDRKALVRQYQQLEHEFFYKQLSSQQLFALTSDGTVVEDSFCYGEFAFLIVGLKPCVLVQFPSARENIIPAYKRFVVDPLLERMNAFQIRAVIIDTPVKGIELGELRGSLLIYNSGHELACQVQSLLLLPSSTFVSEDQLALLFDYPGSLPENEEQLSSMLEVAYLDGSRGDMRVITTFAALEPQLEHVKKHFSIYRNVCSRQLDMDLRLVIRRPIA